MNEIYKLTGENTGCLTITARSRWMVIDSQGSACETAEEFVIT
jgi:hypothetical protein